MSKLLLAINIFYCIETEFATRHDVMIDFFLEMLGNFNNIIAFCAYMLAALAILKKESIMFLSLVHFSMWD